MSAKTTSASVHAHPSPYLLPDRPDDVAYEPPPMPPQKPKQVCSLVMKGGVTSGVVFPGTIRVLGTEYCFKRLGGTSAGAIAAAFAAAAEYRRREDEARPNAGFDRLWQISSDLSAAPKQLPSLRGAPQTNLEALFAPNHCTQHLYRVLSAAMHHDHKGWRVPLALLRSYPLPMLLTGAGVLGSALGLSKMLLGNREASSQALGGTLLLGAGLTTLARSALLGGKDTLEKNHFGLSRGYEQGQTGDAPRFTEWLHASLQSIAGKPSTEPLTFGDLAPQAYALDSLITSQSPEEQRRLLYGELKLAEDMAYLEATKNDIELRQITTCLTFGRPYVLPMDAQSSDTKNFYFRPKEWEAFFPPEIVGWLKAHSERQISFGDPPPPDGDWEYYRLPPAQHLPVAVTTRLSMSFPALFSAVPMYSGTHLGPDAKDADRKPIWTFRVGKNQAPIQMMGVMRQVYFGDGGMTSNFPLSLFDDLVADHPMFALNLEYRNSTDAKAQPPRDDPPESFVRLTEPQAFKLPNMPDRHANSVWHPTPSRIGGIGGYAASLIESARNWVDNAMIPLPGNSERIVHIAIDAGQGGTNLTMTADQIKTLRHRGARAGEMLIWRFKHSPWNWEVQRAAGFLTLTADIERLLQAYARVYAPRGVLNVNLGLLPLQSPAGQAQAFFPGAVPWVNTRAMQFVALGQQPTTLRGYRRMRGKRGVLRYRPLT